MHHKTWIGFVILSHMVFSFPEHSDDTNCWIWDVVTAKYEYLKSKQALPISKSQSLIKLLAGKLETEADKIILSKDMVRNIIQYLRSVLEHTASRSYCRELIEGEEEIKTFKAHCRQDDLRTEISTTLVQMPSRCFWAKPSWICPGIRTWRKC